MRAFSTVALLITSVLSITVTQPSSGTIWDLTPTHTVAWISVSTDPANFSIVLVNEHVNPPYTQLLKALVVTTDNTTAVNAPSTGWPVGATFQINVVQDANNLTGILAQSQNFTIRASPSSTTSSSLSSSGLPSSLSGDPTYTATTGTGSAIGGMNVQTGLMVAAALLGAALV